MDSKTSALETTIPYMWTLRCGNPGKIENLRSEVSRELENVFPYFKGLVLLNAQSTS